MSSPISLQSEKYMAQKWEAEAKSQQTTSRTQESLHAFCQFLMAIGIILLIVNFPESVAYAVEILQNWFQQFVR